MEEPEKEEIAAVREWPKARVHFPGLDIDTAHVLKTQSGRKGTGGRASAAFEQASRHHQPGRAVRENAISTSIFKVYRRFQRAATGLRALARWASRFCASRCRATSRCDRLRLRRWHPPSNRCVFLSRLMMPTDPWEGRRGLSAVIPRSRTQQNLNVTAMPSAQSSLACKAPLAGNPDLGTQTRTAGRRNPIDRAAYSGCTICTQLADADGRYFGRLMRDARARTALAQTIATSMGFCTGHAALVAAPCSEAPWALGTIVSEARHHLGSLLERTDLQDELLQDILFNARGRCPACAYFHRIEGRAISHVLRSVDSARRTPRPELCFVHTQLLAQRAEPPLRSRLVRFLRTRARDVLTTFDASPEMSADDRVAMVRMLIYPLGRSEVPRPQADCACPVCEASRVAHEQWLTAAADNVRLEQPGWITLPTCHTHLLRCLEQADGNLQRAALQRYLEAALPGRPAPASGEGSATKRRRRNKVRWFDAATRAAEINNTASASHASGAPQHEPCPGCDTEEIAARRAIAQLIRKVSRAAGEEVMLVTSGLCLKHFAEALIYASDPVIERRLTAALCRNLHRDPEVLTPPTPISASSGSKAGLFSRQRLANPAERPSAG